MKQKMSITVEEEKIQKVEEYVRKGAFRNKSHALEQGLDILLASLEAENEQL
ncbi:hypothetical protein J4461_03955 [Candidatus Pacearchaeota archaeon]|nr:hypothetical protein [Candidatus Pacearchaeota archaeon]